MLAASALTGCGASSSGGIRADPLPVTVAAPCDHPSDVVATVAGRGVGRDEVRLGRVGDALIECAAEKAVVVAAYDALREITSKSKEAQPVSR